jgi:hypothetical protein
MKTMQHLLSASALALFAATAQAGVWSDDNVDLYGWVVEDAAPATAHSPQVSSRYDGNIDLYGWVIFDRDQPSRNCVAGVSNGNIDMFGSVLFDVGVPIGFDTEQLQVARLDATRCAVM